MDTQKTSTDPQENEIDSNILGSTFRKVFGDGDKDRPEEDKTEQSRTVDEEQDPANK